MSLNPGAAGPTPRKSSPVASTMIPTASGTGSPVSSHCKTRISPGMALSTLCRCLACDPNEDARISIPSRVVEVFLMFRQFRRGVGAVIYARYDGYSVARAGAAGRANQHPTSPLLVRWVKRSGPSRAATSSGIRNSASSAVMRKTASYRSDARSS